MSKLRNLLVLLPIVLIISSCTSQPALPTVEEATESVIAKEREALDQWSAGNPGGFTVNMAMDVTYMDDIGAHSRLDGFEEVQNYLSSLDGMIPPHSYEVQDPKVQVYGDVAVLTLRYQGSVDGEAVPAWKASSVYHYQDGDWKAVHAHWSLVKEQPDAEEEETETEE
jgi:hypothetical protein